MSMGIENLRQRLSVILFDHIKKELPKVEVEIIKEHQSVVDSLTHLGGSRSTQSERREFLLKVAETFRNLVQRADNGSYKHDFFGKGDKERQLATGDNIKRLRASVVYLNDQFASQMRQFGHKFRIEETDKTIGTNPSDESHEPRLNDDYKKAHHLQKPMEYKAAIEWAEGQLVIDRGHELSGHSNAELVGTLFQTQSEHWAELSKAHLSRMATLCESFTQAAIHYAVGSADDVATKLLRRHLVPKLQQRHEAAEFELQQLLLDLADMPQTSNQEFSKQCREALAKEIQGNLRQDLSGASVELTSGKNGEQGKSVISSAMLALKWVSGNLNRNPDKLTAENALVALLVYYKVRMLRGNPRHFTYPALSSRFNTRKIPCVKRIADPDTFFIDALRLPHPKHHHPSRRAPHAARPRRRPAALGAREPLLGGRHRGDRSRARAYHAGAGAPGRAPGQARAREEGIS